MIINCCYAVMSTPKLAASVLAKFESYVSIQVDSLLTYKYVYFQIHDVDVGLKGAELVINYCCM